MGDDFSNLSFKNSSGQNRSVDDVVYKTNGSDVFEITAAVAFPEDATKEEYELLTYQLENNRLGIVVPTSLITSNLPGRELVIDPLGYQFKHLGHGLHYRVDVQRLVQLYKLMQLQSHR
jgi:hypothetical protein